MTVAPVVCSARARRRMSRRPRAPLAPGMPRRLLAARTPVCSMQPGLRPPRVLSPDPVTTPGCPVLGECVRGGARRHCPCTPRRLHHPPCVLSPDPVTTPGLPVPGGCVRGGRQTESRPRDDPGAPRPRGMRARGAPGRTAPSPSRSGHDQHAHATRPALLPRRTSPRSPWRTCRPHRHFSTPSTPHPVDDVPTFELVPCLTRGRVGALRGRHTATT